MYLKLILAPFKSIQETLKIKILFFIVTLFSSVLVLKIFLDSGYLVCLTWFPWVWETILENERSWKLECLLSLDQMRRTSFHSLNQKSTKNHISGLWLVKVLWHWPKSNNLFVDLKPGVCWPPFFSDIDLKTRQTMVKG